MTTSVERIKLLVNCLQEYKNNFDEHESDELLKWTAWRNKLPEGVRAYVHMDEGMHIRQCFTELAKVKKRIEFMDQLPSQQQLTTLRSYIDPCFQYVEGGGNLKAKGIYDDALKALAQTEDKENKHSIETKGNKGLTL